MFIIPFHLNEFYLENKNKSQLNKENNQISTIKSFNEKYS